MKTTTDSNQSTAQQESTIVNGILDRISISLSPGGPNPASVAVIVQCPGAELAKEYYDRQVGAEIYPGEHGKTIALGIIRIAWVLDVWHDLNSKIGTPIRLKINSAGRVIDVGHLFLDRWLVRDKDLELPDPFQAYFR